MPNWNSVLQETIQQQSTAPVDIVRRKYLAELHLKTGRNIIAYYSGWLDKPHKIPQLSIGDADKTGFMTAVHGLDRERGLDLIIHTPGGDLAATESLVDYLWQQFGQDIRVIVPQIAMSAGTMIACSARTILMGKQSNLGPIDPQFGGIAAQAVLDEFDMAKEQIKNDPSCIPLWQTIVGQYHPTFLLECRRSIEWSQEMVRSWLCRNMFAQESNAVAMAEEVIRVLGDHAGTKTHSRHLSMADCQAIGLKIHKLEEDNDLQDLVLTWGVQKRPPRSKFIAQDLGLVSRHLTAPPFNILGH
ncbi:MAG: S49 family peptidase [Magnetococcales bacterium]|nr:S49 family peptidase [Magnetococcales bacterium]